MPIADVATLPTRAAQPRNTLSEPAAEPYSAAVINSGSAVANRPVALFLLGNGRSGTAALARVLSLCGAALPPGLLGANSENPRGFFEPRAVIHLNQAILHDHGSSGYDTALAPHEQGEFDVAGNSTWVNKARNYLRGLPPAPVVVIKEPKTTTVARIWFEAARQAGFDVAVVIAVRDPEEIIGSLAKRAGQQNYVDSSPELTCAWWLKYSLLAERDTRDVPRVFVEYANLLDDWRREVKRIATALAIDLDVQDERAIDEFLTPALRHHQTRGAVTEPFGTDWVRTVYETLATAARDEPCDTSTMDRVYAEYDAAERGFRRTFDDVRRYRNIDRLLPPFLVKVALETLALVHRRKETWA